MTDKAVHQYHTCMEISISPLAMEKGPIPLLSEYCRHRRPCAVLFSGPSVSKLRTRDDHATDYQVMFHPRDGKCRSIKRLPAPESEIRVYSQGARLESREMKSRSHLGGRSDCVSRRAEFFWKIWGTRLCQDYQKGFVGSTSDGEYSHYVVRSTQFL